MTIQLGIGKTDFGDFRSDGDYYVDKSEILYHLVNKDNNVTLFTRPRRFGKTLMMSMMEHFFDIRKNSSGLFEGLAVMKYEAFCRDWMNQYPVLFITFKGIDKDTFETSYEMLKYCISDVCKRFTDIIEDPAVDPDDRAAFLRLKSITGTEGDIQNSLKILTRILYSVYGKKVIILLDEYDVPLARASERDPFENGYYRKMLDTMRGILNTALKDNPFLKFAVITGCLRIAKESIFSGTNHFVSYTVLDDAFSSYFGFSKDEVDRILAKAGFTEKADEIEEWYDGYIFGNSRVYCPWDVMNYVSDLKENNDAKPKNYWKNTSHNGILLTFVERTDFNVSRQFETLLNHGVIYKEVTAEQTYDSLHASENNFWSILLMTGYITKAGKGDTGETTVLRIPNKEIAKVFEDTVVEYFRRSADTSQIRQLMDSLWNKDAAKASAVISDLLWHTISYHDYHEDYYHAFLAGVFVARGYEVESNKEKGLGRPDILLLDQENRRAIIVEAKKSDHQAAMNADCDEALRQIVEKKYAEGLYGYEQILCYGISFFQKQAKVKLLSADDR